MTLRLCWHNAFWYFALYGLVSWLVMAFVPSKARKKVLTYVPSQNKREKASLTISRIFRVLAYAVAPFTPVNAGTWNFYAGTFLYAAGLILSTLALWQFSRADTEKPITSGLYRYSRHPMQVMFYLLCIGVLLASANLYLSICVFVYMLSFYPSFSLQEAYCREKYGAEYTAYQNRTPRLLFVNRQPKGDIL